MHLFKNLVIKAIILATFTLSGCSYLKPYKAPITQGTIIKSEQLSLIQTGLTVDQVQSILGPPFGKDPFNPLHWEYVFYTTDRDLYPESVRYLSLNFDTDNYLLNWKIKDKDVVLDKDTSLLSNFFDE